MEGRMTDTVGIVGLGEPENRRTNNDSLEELAHHASHEALRDASLDREEIDNITVCATDLEDGRAISSMVTVGPAGGYRKDFLKTTDTGVHALALAAMRIRSGVHDNSLVVSWGKQSETDLNTIRYLENEPFGHRNTGLGHVSGHAVQAAAYEETVDGAADAADAVVMRGVNNAADNPRSVSNPSAAVGDDSVVSWPLTEEHLPPETDGATAMVVGGEAMVDASNDPVVTLEGFGLETATYNAGNRPFGKLDALEGAADAAYNSAGVEDPRTAFDTVEIHAKSAYHELMACEALGLCAEREAAEETLSGSFDRDGELPVNASGGPYAANPLVGAGLQRVTASVRQLRGDADYLEERPDRVLAHATAGYTDQLHGVAVLGRANA
jgi:acetyl-CoA C-acetyltransferase